MCGLAWRSPRSDGRFGAACASESGFVFGNLGRKGGMTLPATEPPGLLSDVMHKAWVAFATSGAPGWTPYDAHERRVMRFDAAGGTVLMDPAAKERQLWDGIR